MDRPPPYRVGAVDMLVEKLEGRGDPALPLTRLGGGWGRGLELSLGREGDKDRVEIAREGEELNPWTFVGGFSLSHHCVD